MIGGFALGVFVSDIDALVGVVGVVYEVVVVVDGIG